MGACLSRCTLNDHNLLEVLKSFVQQGARRNAGLLSCLS